MDSAPPSPSERRRSAQFDALARSRRSSQQSQKRMSHGAAESPGLHEAGNGLDSLADELGGDWDEDEDDIDETFADKSSLDDSRLLSPVEGDKIRDSGIGVASPTSDAPNKQLGQSKQHVRMPSRYDGSEYGELMEHELPSGLPATLKVQMADVEGLAKLDTDNDNVTLRVIDELRDLGGQSGIESGATRLITAHTALTMHLTHQTRSLQTLTYALLSPLSPPPDDDLIEELLPLIADSIAMIPQPMVSALSSMVKLSDSSREVILTLNGLADSLHMSRQIASDANRRLKSSRELVAEIRRETTACDEGMRFVEEGKWQSRLADRECASVCKDVVGGFEEVCQSWRDKLVASAEISAA